MRLEHQSEFAPLQPCSDGQWAAKSERWTVMSASKRPGDLQDLLDQNEELGEPIV